MVIMRLMNKSIEIKDRLKIKKKKKTLVKLL